MRKTAYILTLSAAIALGCNGEAEAEGAAATVQSDDAAAAAVVEPGPTGPIEIGLELDEAQQAAADALVEQITRGAFPRAERRNGENGPLFLHLAARNEDPAVVAAALQALTDSWTARESTRNPERQVVDDDYRTVVRAFLSASEPVVLARAINASRLALNVDPPDREAAEALARIATTHPNPAARYDALSVLWNFNNWDRDETLAGAYVAALGASEPHIVSQALFRTRNRAQLGQIDGYRAKVEGLTSHDDPGVRGRSIVALAHVSRSDDEKAAASERARAMLSDAHPYVRSEALEALGILRRLSDVPAIMPLLEDAERNTYDIEGWTQLDGTSGRVHHDGSAWSRVDDAALAALRSISSGMRDDAFRPPRVEAGKVDEGLAEAVAQAKAWFEQHKSSFE